MHRLTNEIRDYAWGSRTHIPRLLGREPGDGPAAELWLGAHPGAPSRLPDGRTLREAVADDPERLLGPEVAARFGELPFLMKVLAAAEPLSLQVHPTAVQAEQGYAGEEAAGVPVDAPERRYRDTSHKPELILALTRFEGMAGFRDPGRSAAILRLVGTERLDLLAARLDGAVAVGGEEPVEVLRQVVTELLALPEEDVVDLVAEVARAAEEADGRPREPRRGSPRRHLEREAVARESRRVFAQTTALARRHPSDPGVLVTLLLNHVVLAPGEAMYLPPGMVHAYTSGLGVEVMASSDNVLRAGLTPKHVDVPELLAITDFSPCAAPRWPAEGLAGATVFAPPVAEFRLAVASAPSDTLPDAGPRILLCLDGQVEVCAGGAAERLVSGESVFVAAVEGPVRLAGAGRVAACSVPPA